MSTGATLPVPPVNRPHGHLTAQQVHRTDRGLRAFIFYSLAVLLTGVGSLLFADLLWRFGWSASKTVELILFAILFMGGSIGCMHGIYGFILRRLGGGNGITSSGIHQNCSVEGTSTVLLFPMHNENVPQVYAGLRATYESLAATGQLDHFDFFILSDSTDPDKWVEEEQRWFEMVRELDALGRIHYRHRPTNEGKKSGNIRDFLNLWGLRYRYFVVFDADSLMIGALLVDLVKLMESHPAAGLIQTACALAGARTAFARMQQFANRFYGPVFFPGLNFWSQEGGNYWGHNAIIRTEPFMKFCDLPQLPGKKPFGGQILSHDFIEAALMRKENWEVWFAWDLDGSYEEGPSGIIDNALRDRRWCEGNLQHFMLLFARGLRGINRLHLTLGIISYLAAPIWLGFMLNSTYMLWLRKDTGLSDVAVAAFTPFIHLDVASHALLVFGLSMLVIFLPKILSLLDLAFDAQRRDSFGGFSKAFASTVLETIFSALHAPLQMLLHTKFVAETILGSAVKWGSQTRTNGRTGWRLAFRFHWWQTFIGLAWAAVVWWLDPMSFWWFLPVLTGMVVAMPISVFTSRESVGDAFRRAGFFLTPEETAAPAELVRLQEHLDAEFSGPVAVMEQAHGLRDAILDPYINAIHVSLLLEKRLNPHDVEKSKALETDGKPVQKICEKILASGPGAITAKEQLAVLSDPDAMSRLHREAWMQPDGIFDKA